MMRGVAALAAAISLIGCDGAAETPPTQPQVETRDLPGDVLPDRVPGGIALTEVGDLVGEYRVVRIDEQPIPQEPGITVSIDGPILSFDPTCAGFMWDVEFDGETLSLPRHRPPVPELELAPGEVAPPPPPVCTIAIAPEWSKLAGAFDAATRAERMDTGGIRIAGGGRSVTLYPQ